MESSQYGTIQISFNLETYLPGDTLIGRVHLDLKQSYPGNSLYLQVKGKEKVKVNGPLARDDKLYIFNLETVLYDITESLVFPAGQYEFPFSFKVPDDTPATLDLDGLVPDISDCRIYHYVKVFIKSNDAASKPLSGKKQFIVREKDTDNEEMSPPSGNIDANITKCFCIKNEHISASFQLDKNAYEAGENAEFTIEVNTRLSSIPVRAVNVALSCSIQVGDRDKSSPYVVDAKLTTATLPGFPARQTATLSESRRLTNIQLKRRDGKPLPRSSTSTLINVNYFVDTELDVEQNAIIKINRTFGREKLTVRNTHKVGEAPGLSLKNWNPKTFDVLRIAVASLLQSRWEASTSEDTFHM
jgi:sporulation-control protein spo0M